MTVVIGFHVYWAASAAYNDYKGSYSCGREVAQLLKQNDIQERRVYAKNFWSIAALPFFTYVFFLVYNLSIDVLRAVLSIPGKLDKMIDSR